MRNLLLSFFILSISLTSCYYDEGPIISLRTPENRLVNKWQYQKVTVNGQDWTEVFKNGYVEFKSDKSSTFYLDSSFQYNAAWELSDDYKNLYLDCIRQDTSGNDSTWSADYYILKLRDKELWMKSDEGSTVTYIELIEF